ncbi:hypothetical protein ACHMW4_29625 [Mesorhizobium sp. UC22_110]|uniref:hypothetical protein n=1 Tax=Mesorhizobium sp. UC22_110 TaxID=3374552 RepID=UPI0037578BBB
MVGSVVGLRPLLGMVLLAFGCGAARADDAADRWRFGSASDGSITASLSADSIIAIGSGALGYRPVLTIACRPDGEPQWSEWLQLNDGVAVADTITVAVSVDRGENVREDWSVSNGSRTLIRPGPMPSVVWRRPSTSGFRGVSASLPVVPTPISFWLVPPRPSTGWPPNARSRRLDARIVSGLA